MDPAWLIIGTLVIGSALVLIVVILLRRARIRFQAAEDQRMRRLQQETDDNWQKALAKRRSSTIQDLPPGPPGDAGPQG